MFNGFKQFILRGNVIDLAVAVVIGAAFTAIVNAVVAGVFNPVIGLLFNSASLQKLAVPLRGNPGDADYVALQYGSLIAAVIQFLLVAIVVYFGLIVPMNYLKKNSFWRKQEGKPPVAADQPPTELELLADIRDLLARSARTGSSAEPEPFESSGRHAAPTGAIPIIRAEADTSDQS